MIKSPEWYEKEILIHRYLYYVESSPVISDFEYDRLEREAREVCEESSPVHRVGSSLPSSYPKEVITEALGRIE